MTLGLPGDPRPWEDEVVYGIIIEKFFDGNPSNNVMRDRFLKDRARYEGGFWGGDLKGVALKLDDLADLGVTAILLYPVVQNDEKPVGKFLPTGYRPKDYEHVDVNFGDIAILRSLVDAAHGRGVRVILDMPITLPGFEHPYLVDPGKKDWFGPRTQYGVGRWKVEKPEVADYLIGVCKRWKERSRCDGFRIDSCAPPADFLLEAIRRRAEGRSAAGTVPALAGAHDQSSGNRPVRDRGRFRRGLRLQRAAGARCNR